MTNLPEGFIPWGGGECPCPDAAADVLFRDGRRHDYIKAYGFKASGWDWSHDDRASDIIAYRPIPDTASKGE